VNGKCQGVTYCGGPIVNGFCPVAPPTNTSMTLPPLRCDFDFGRGAGYQGLGDCPPLANADKTEVDNYCLGFKQGEIDLANQQQQNHVIK